MTRLLLSILFVLALQSPCSAYVVPGIPADSLGPKTGFIGKKPSNIYRDTTGVVDISGYRWVHVWITGRRDSCVVIAQKAFRADTSAALSTWAVKDSTLTLASAWGIGVMYDSLYVRGVIREPCIPAPYMRWIVISRESGCESGADFENIKNIEINVVGGK
jgi:hypothetical protein